MRDLVSSPLRLPGLGGLAVALLLAAWPTSSAMSLDEVYGGMAGGCTYDAAANYRIITAYVDEHTEGPKLARPEGGRQLAPFLGRASLIRTGEFYTLEIPVSGATLYGIPVSRLAPYRGIGSGIAGVTITFPIPLSAVRSKLDSAGVKLVADDNEWGEIEPVLQPVAEDSSSTELVCDRSM
jgi:hypothetical protein